MQVTFTKDITRFLNEGINNKSSLGELFELFFTHENLQGNPETHGTHEFLLWHNFKLSTNIYIYIYEYKCIFFLSFNILIADSYSTILQ